MSSVLDYYGLQYQPFPLRLNDSGRQFLTKDLANTKAVLQYTMNEMGISMICGDTGRGISYAVYCFTQSLDQTQVTVKCVPLCHICPRDFYRETCRVIGAAPPGRSRQAMITAMRQGAMDLKSHGRPLFLVLDNAQNLPDLVLWDLVALTSSDFGLENLMTLVLCGTKDLKYRIQLPENQNLEENLATHYVFKGLSEEETKDYVKNRITSAGGREDLVSEESLDALYELSCRGSIRELNNVMRTALMIGSQAGRKEIDLEVLRAAVEHRKL
jgi:general secretion pathway protein A